MILSYMDQAGAVGARHVIQNSGWSDKTIVSVGMQSVAFRRPVFVGDVVSFRTRLKQIGTTSITIEVNVEAGAANEFRFALEKVGYVENDGSVRPLPQP